ncbi:carboxymuconolactone decarboxylase family protein [Streptomyces sp. NPDC047002]|uniref:carboxymuconolactone decarboxylase family protein n=1 Tax=Streptomyces sp. NPDC047002 TaxID=3155475 RepID=UPI0034527466
MAPVPFRTRDRLVTRVYRASEEEFGVLPPPLVLHASSPEVLAAVWLILRESLLTPGLVGRVEKETVAAMISAANSCPYCVTMHTSMLRSLGRADGSGAVAAWCEVNMVRGPGPQGAGPAARTPPFPPEHGPELVAMAVLLHYLNRMVNIFLGDRPLPPWAPAATLPAVQPVLNWLQRAAGRDDLPPGLSLDLLPAAEPAPDLVWSAGKPPVTEAFARAVAAVENAGERSLPASVRALVRERLRVWDGRPPGLSRAWVDTETERLAPSDRPAGRLALLTAIASYQVDDEAVRAFRNHNPEDARLVEATAWAALCAAREAGAWMAVR